MGQQAYTKAPVKLQWKVLDEMMQPFTSKDDSYALGLKAYVGWDGSVIWIAIAPLFLLPTTNAKEYRVLEGQPFETVQRSGKWALEPILDWGTRWKGNESACINRYYADTMVKRIGAGPEPLDTQKDPCASMVSFDGVLLPLFQQNKHQGDDPDLVELKISHEGRWE